jgi:tetratricopeptide (TPR) repeat protein
MSADRRSGGAVQYGEFTGTDRFRVLARLGAGAMGVVYRARDVAHGRDVALKTLQRFDPAGLYRFKQEFRSIADVVHRNLVTLYELFSEQDRWFFTMELVDGVEFRRFVCGSAPEREPSSSRVIDVTASAPTSSSVTGADELPPFECDLGRLRDAFRQLALGVEALHASGRLHRDIKPSNVMVDRSGRVVLLDFGLVSARRSASGDSIADPMGGTPAYMAPEQAAGAELGPACDWYSVGVMLYDVLAGRLPFEGTVMHVLDAKRRQEAPPLLRPGVPPELAELAMALVRRSPAERPNGVEILRRLRTTTAPYEVRSQAPAPLFLGRRAELEALEAGRRRAAEGVPVVVHVHGPSGMGKTTLVEHFLEGLRADERVTVLAGRCYERESVRYKALDSVIDALSRRLRRLGEQAEVLLPRDVWSLVRLFPVLQQARAVATAPAPAADIPDPQELRRRAFAALKELLARIADRGALVIWIDDLQWGDADSAALLAELLRPPDAPALLLIASYRGEDSQTSECVRALRAVAGAREVRLDPLSRDDASELALALLPTKDAVRADQIAREAEGNPFFVTELVRQGDSGGSATLEEVLQLRVSELQAQARRLLEVIAVAGGPIEISSALGASGAGNEGAGALALLRARRLVRATASGEHVEAYHDRVRETVVRHLDHERLRECHAALAAALESTGRADPEALAGHLEAAGDVARAGHYAARAARAAAEALAFDRAAQLYRRALKCGQPVQADLATALANAGRGREAAEAFLAAAEAAPPSLVFDLRRRAAEEYLKSGHVAEGLAILRIVLQAVGERMPATPRRALIELLVRRAALRLRGLSYREQSAGAVNPWTLMRIDACRSASVGLSPIDPIQGANFQTRHTFLALRAGEPSRISSALAIEAAHMATEGSVRRAEETMARSRELAERVGEPYPLGLGEVCHSVIDYCQGHWRAAREHSERAAAILRDRCTGVAWEIDSSWVFYMASCFYLGEMGDLARHHAQLVEDAQARGDLYAAISMRSAFGNTGWLAADEVDRARQEVRIAREQWIAGAFHVQHMYLLLGETFVDRYAGDGTKALSRIDAAWPSFERSLLGFLPILRAQMVQARGASALAAAAGSPEASATRGLLKTAARAARELTRSSIAAFHPTGLLLGAGVAALRGQTRSALDILDQAAAGFDAADMTLFAAAARRCHGVLSGGTAGAARIAEADRWMALQGIRSPANITRMLAPGFP